MSSLYLHIPYCERKCLYCDFYSIENLSSVKSFLRALGAEIATRGHSAKDVEFDTVFFGGGTPSLLSPLQLDGIMQLLRETFPVSPGAEVTLETNPGTVTAEKLAAYRALGINRLSIGIQSFREEELRFLGRIHDRRQAEQCFRDARSAGFDNVSVDLIYSLPGQTAQQWDESLDRGLALQPEHISAYSLIVEDRTPLARMVAAKQVSPNPLETEALLYENTMVVLQREGFEHYEVSNFARPGFRSRHNLAYWTHKNYLGFGPSAHSFWHEEEWGNGRRWSNVAQVSSYCKNLMNGELPVAFEEVVNRQDLMNERLFLGLRSGGVDLDRMSLDFGLSLPPARGDTIRQLVTEGLATLRNGVVCLTSAGYLLCDEIAARLMV